MNTTLPKQLFYIAIAIIDLLIYGVVIYTGWNLFVVRAAPVNTITYTVAVGLATFRLAFTYPKSSEQHRDVTVSDGIAKLLGMAIIVLAMSIISYM